MAFKPNYGQERAARNRAKEEKKQEKLQRRQQDLRRTACPESSGPEGDPRSRHRRRDEWRSQDVGDRCNDG